MTKHELPHVIGPIANALGKRNRFGKLESTSPGPGEPLRKLLPCLGAPHDGRDRSDQAVYVTPAVMAREPGWPAPEMPK